MKMIYTMCHFIKVILLKLRKPRVPNDPRQDLAKPAVSPPFFFFFEPNGNGAQPGNVLVLMNCNPYEEFNLSPAVWLQNCVYKSVLAFN